MTSCLSVSCLNRLFLDNNVRIRFYCYQLSIEEQIAEITSTDKTLLKSHSSVHINNTKPFWELQKSKNGIVSIKEKDSNSKMQE